VQHERIGIGAKNGDEAQREAVTRFVAAEGLELIGELTEVETGKGADMKPIRACLFPHVPRHHWRARELTPLRSVQRTAGRPGRDSRRAAHQGAAPLFLRLRDIRASNLRDSCAIHPLAKGPGGLAGDQGVLRPHDAPAGE
jgi:hypothetical protein